MSFLIIMVLLLVVMYVLMIRPQRQRQAQQQAMITGASVGDDVLTTGGIYGTVMQAEGDDVVVEIAEGLQVHMTRRGIAAVLPPEDEVVDGESELELPDEESAEALRRSTREETLQLDEASVIPGEEAVTSDVGADNAAGDRR